MVIVFLVLQVLIQIFQVQLNAVFVLKVLIQMEVHLFVRNVQLELILE